MDDFIELLEQETSLEKMKKEIYKDGETVLYHSDSIGILKCNTLDGNQDIYIGDNNLIYEERYCK